MKQNILIADDDSDILELLRFHLDREGYNIFFAQDGQEAWSILNDESIDLAVLDIGMPGLSGVDVCRRMKRDERLKTIPLIFVTARVMESDLVVGFQAGAEDYIRKPFSVKELVIRVNSILRRAKGVEDVYRLKQFDISFDRHLCKIEGERVNLTHHEFGLINVLIHADGRTVSRNQLLEKVWGMETHSSPRSVDIVVTRVRDKITPYNNCIRTIPGIGYQWDSEGINV